MSVKDAIGVLTDAKKLYVAWDSTINPIDPQDSLMMDAFGDYKVRKICHGTENQSFEIHVAAIPEKEVRA